MWGQTKCRDGLRTMILSLLMVVSLGPMSVFADVPSVLGALRSANNSMSGRFLVVQVTSENAVTSTTNYYYVRKGDRSKRLDSANIGYIFNGTMGVTVSGNELISTFNAIPDLISPTLLTELVNQGQLTLSIDEETTESVTLYGSGGGASVTVIVKKPEYIIRDVDIITNGQLLIQYRSTWMNGVLTSESIIDTSTPVPTHKKRTYSPLYGITTVTDSEFDISGYLR